jgi:penicillin-binding protein 2
MTITDAMAAATTTGTAAAAHIDGVDFAGKTGTAQVVGGGDTHVKGGAKTPNSWFVGMVPRRNPELVVAVLQEHGDWGSNSAKIAARMVALYVEKKRKQEHNLMERAGTDKPVEVGAVWSDPEPAGPTRAGRRGKEAARQDSTLHAGHFFVDPKKALGLAVESKPLASGNLTFPAWLTASSPIRFREREP